MQPGCTITRLFTTTGMQSKSKPLRLPSCIEMSIWNSTMPTSKVCLLPYCSVSYLIPCQPVFSRVREDIHNTSLHDLRHRHWKACRIGGPALPLHTDPCSHQCVFGPRTRGDGRRRQEFVAQCRNPRTFVLYLYPISLLLMCHFTSR